MTIPEATSAREGAMPDTFARQTKDMLLRKMIERGLTQRIVAERIGVTEARLSQMLHDRSNLTLRSVDRILDAIHTPPPAALTKEDRMSKCSHCGGTGIAPDRLTLECVTCQCKVVVTFNTAADLVEKCKDVQCANCKKNRIRP